MTVVLQAVILLIVATAVAWAWLDLQDALATPNDEPTDFEIYNGFNREGGISYTIDEPGSLGENDPRL